MKKDLSFSNQNKTFNSSVIGVASPKDRIAAFILDSLILIPIIQLIQAPIKKHILETLLYNSQGDVSSYRVLNFFVALIILVIYQTIFTYWKGQTIGKMYFHIQVISYHGTLTLLQSLMRSIVFVFEFITLGWLWAPLLSHPLRRVLHDRASDTLVIALKNPVEIPSRKEILSHKLINGMFVVFLLISFAGFFFSSEEDLDLVEMNYSKRLQCKDIKEKYKNKIESLVVAFLGNQISSDCLHSAARKTIWSENDQELSYFAMALSLHSSPEKSDLYLEQLCQLNSVSSLCLVSQWLREKHNGKNTDIIEIHKKLALKNNPIVVDLIISLYLQKAGHFSESLKVAEGISKREVSERLVSALSFQSLLSLGNIDEAYWVYKTHSDMGVHNLRNFYSQFNTTDKEMIKNHLHFLEKLYPQIVKTQGRSLASKDESVGLVEKIYIKLKDQL